MRWTTIVVAVLVSASARAETPAGAAGAPPPSDAAAESARRIPRRGDEGRFFLKDGREVRGRLVTKSDAADVVALEGGGRLVLPGRSVVGFIPDPPPPAPWSSVPPGGVRATLLDGRVVEGRLAARDDDALKLVLASGAVVRVRSEELREVFVPGRKLASMRGHVDPARARSLWSPNAFTLERREVALEATQAVAVSAAVGLVEGLMVSAGSTLPAWYADGFGVNGTASVKGGWSFAPGLRAAVGVESYLSAQGAVFTGFGAVTLGRQRSHVSLYAGPAPTGAFLLGDFGDRIVSASASWAMSRRIAVLGEGWTRMSSDRSAWLAAVGARAFWRRVAVDVGVASASEEPLLPFLSIAWTAYAP
jgi:hypothetical protein